MTEPRLLQNFSGGRAIVVTDRASSLDILTTSLDRLGVTTNPADIVESVAAIDLATLQPDRTQQRPNLTGWQRAGKRGRTKGRVSRHGGYDNTVHRIPSPEALPT